MAKPEKHSLDVKDRGEGHIHRWLPTCTCGQWTGIPIRDKARAAGEYRAHVAAAQREAHRGTVSTTLKRSNRQGAGRRGRSRHAQPQPLTPWADLPPELQ